MNMMKWKIWLVLVLILMILNTASASQIEVVGLCDTIGQAWDVKVVGPYAYIADYRGGLCIIDVSDPFEPTLEGLYTTGENFVGITVRDEYAYVASYEGFFIFDISTPSCPIKIGENSDITSGSVAVSGNYAYLVDIYLHIVDISNPSNPTKVGEYNISNFVYDVFVLGNYAYLANTGGFIIIDISDPFNPTKVWQYTACEARSVVVSDNYAYVATIRGLLVLDVYDKSNPLVVIQYPGSYRDIVVSENYAYVLNTDGNLSVVDMSQFPPVKIEEFDQPYWWITLDVSGDYIYIASAVDGICILKIDTTPDITLPTIIINQPLDGQIYTDDTITVSGSASDESGIHSLTVNGKKVEIKGVNMEYWSKSITLSSGINTITIMATDEEGNTKTVHRTVTYRTPTKSPIHISTPTPTPISALVDSDRDGVPDKYDYAPYDPNVQTKSDIIPETTPAPEPPGFDVILTISGLLTTAYLLKRKNGGK
ncbi:MAG: hypothetical protein KAT65_25895 [Methanophagales archaeon]|nr:hypothetical protein [Methanophagales archaeon]